MFNLLLYSTFNSWEELFHNIIMGRYFRLLRFFGQLKPYTHTLL